MTEKKVNHVFSAKETPNEVPKEINQGGTDVGAILTSVFQVKEKLDGESKTVYFDTETMSLEIAKKPKSEPLEILDQFPESLSLNLGSDFAIPLSKRNHDGLKHLPLNEQDKILNNPELKKINLPESYDDNIEQVKNKINNLKENNSNNSSTNKPK